jgi:broad specificity phosphatase PhoE
MVQVYFIRHAESEYNLAKSNSLEYYKKDCCLTENGIQQAKNLGKN